MVNIKNIILGVGIVIIYGLVLWQGIEAFYPSPQWDNFCPAGRFEGPYPTKVYPGGEPNCTFSKNLQDQQNQCLTDGGEPIFEYDDKGCNIALKTCNFCQKEFKEARDQYAKVIFIVAIIVGILTLIIGYSILSIEPVGSALIGSGVWAIFWGTAINFRNFSNIWRFLLLLITLILIIWIALRLNRIEKKKGFWERLGLKK